MDAHSLLFGSSANNNIGARTTSTVSDVEGGDDNLDNHLNVVETSLMRSDSLTTSNSSSLHSKLHNSSMNSKQQTNNGPQKMGSISSQDGSDTSNSKKKSSNWFGFGGNNSKSKDSSHVESVAYDEKNDGYYEVLFGGGNDHATYDRHKHAVNRLLNENPKEFPPFLPSFSISLFIAFAVSVGYIAALFFLPTYCFKWVPPPIGDSWSDGYLDKNNGWEVRQVLLAYSSIPIVSCIFTYFHIWLALWMMFYPIAFLGCWQIPGTNLGFPMGWQGIVPFKAVKMVAMSVDIILGQLVNMRDEFGKIKPEIVAAILKPSLAAEIAALYPKIAMKHKADLWDRLPESVKDVVVANGVAMASTVVADLMADIQNHLEELIDIKTLVTNHFLSHPKLMNEIFIQCGYQELAFIRNSGGVFGFIFGLIQMVVWLCWHPSSEEPLKASLQGLIVFPVFGLIVGGATNWISLLVIFSPIEPFDVLRFLTTGSGKVNVLPQYKPKPVVNTVSALDKGASDNKVLVQTTDMPLPSDGIKDDRIRNYWFPDGLILQGLFLQRQTQVSRVYGRLVGCEVLTVSRINESLLTGTTVGGPKLLNDLMRVHFTKAFNKSLDTVPTILKGVGISAERILGESEVDAMREDSVKALLESTPKHLNAPKVVEYFEGALGLELTLRTRMEQLPPQNFEQILHPVFQEDEWKLIAVGGGLGVVIGLLQAFFIN